MDLNCTEPRAWRHRRSEELISSVVDNNECYTGLHRQKVIVVRREIGKIQGDQSRYAVRRVYEIAKIWVVIGNPDSRIVRCSKGCGGEDEWLDNRLHRYWCWVVGC